MGALQPGSSRTLVSPLPRDLLIGKGASVKPLFSDVNLLSRTASDLSLALLPPVKMALWHRIVGVEGCPRRKPQALTNFSCMNL